MGGQGAELLGYSHRERTQGETPGSSPLRSDGSPGGQARQFTPGQTGLPIILCLGKTTLSQDLFPAIQVLAPIVDVISKCSYGTISNRSHTDILTFYASMLSLDVLTQTAKHILLACYLSVVTQTAKHIMLACYLSMF
jgi:hypothetical protein